MDLYLILLIFLGFITCVQLYYYLITFGSFSFSKTQKNTSKPKIAVSIIICAKNESENLKRFLPLILDQDYPKFEIVLINDMSYDGATLEIMEEFASNNPLIKIVDVRDTEIDNYWSSKKYAITLGIKAATYDHLLLTDADCYPTSNQWITEMANGFSTEKTVVLGYGAYEQKPGFLNKLIRFETVLTALQYLSRALNGKPYMGVGRNLAYTKTEFFKKNGFVDHMKILSGDDDLFVNAVAHKKNTAIIASDISHTKSIPKETLSAWLTQKRRHISTSKHYKSSDKFVLGLFYISQFLFFVTAIILLVLNYELYIVIGIIATRYLASFLTIGYACKKLHEKNILALYPILEFILILTQLQLFIVNLFSKQNHWK